MANFSTITREDLKKKVDEGGDFVLIDVLGEMSYTQKHLPGAINISWGGGDFVAKVEKAVQDKSKEIIVYCSNFSCQASPASASKLADAGYTNVLDFEGGLSDWENAGYSLFVQEPKGVIGKQTAVL